jgi:serine/threonine protein kinase
MCPTPPPSDCPTTSLRTLGRGAVFEVDLVSDCTGTVLVRKRVAPDKRAFPEAAAALHREAIILERMGGCHLPAFAGSGTDESGSFILQTPAKGLAFRDLFAETTKPLDAETWLRLAVSATSALAELHDRKDEVGKLEFVHGDISPDNAFWDAPDTVTFIDLSNATFRDAPLPVFPQARGTVPYVAPEVARGERPGDAAADTYALAATLLAVAVGPIVQDTTEAARLVEVATSGISANLPERRLDLPAEARQALSLALRFDRTRRLTASRELLGWFLAALGPQTAPES